MKLLKGLILSLLSLVLFFSLSLYGLVFMLDRTLMQPEFVSAELDKLNLAQLFKEMVSSELPLGQQATIDPKVMNDAISSAIAKAEPQIKASARTAVYSGYDYFLGRSNELNISISFEPVMTNLRDTLWQDFQKSPPPQLAGQPQAIVQQYFDQYYQDFAKQFPSGWEIKGSELSPDTLSLLQTIRQYLSYYKILSGVLIGLMVLSVVGIILIERNLKGSTLSLGINLLLYGGIGFVIDFLFNQFGSKYLTVPGLPPSLGTWLFGLMDDIMAPLQVFSIAVMAVGAVLFIVSFIIRKQPEEPQPAS